MKTYQWIENDWGFSDLYFKENDVNSNNNNNNTVQRKYFYFKRTWHETGLRVLNEKNKMKCHCFLNLQGILYTVVNFLGSRREVEMLTLDDNFLNDCFWRKFKCSMTQLFPKTQSFPADKKQNDLYFI